MMHTSNTGTDPARVLVFSQRGWNSRFYMPLTYEFEDTIARIDDADILAPPFRWRSRATRFMYKGSNWFRNSAGLWIDPGFSSIEIDRDYDLFFCLLSFAYETPTFRKLKNLRKRCKKAVCMFVELWSSHAERF